MAARASPATTDNLSNGPHYLPVAEFYRGRHIFITGGTGFMGKVLLEKLLRSCPGIGKIYLLIRPKRGQHANERLKQVLGSPLLEYLRRHRPSALEKVIAVEGDITQPELGISTSDQQILFQNVSIVFHSAATVKFDEQLKLSVTINMLGTKRLVELCHKMYRLEALVHVSTAYCNCERTVVGEQIYKQYVEPDHVTRLVEWFEEPLIDQFTAGLIGNRPNTYTFTKALAESMLQELAGSLPVAIVRPSIVLSSLEGPLPGWIDNWNGPTGMIAAAGKGMFRTMVCRGEKVADLVPVDIVCNTMICTAWRTAQQASTVRNGTAKTAVPITVYNVCTGQQKPISWQQFINLCFVYVRKHPFGDIFWYPDGSITTSPINNYLRSFFLQWCPAYVLDFFASIAGKKPMMLKVQEKLAKAAECLEYFTMQEWEFKDDNVRHLNSTLSEEDKREFLMDVKQIQWDKYIEMYVLGIRQFIFKEDPDTLPIARSQLKKLSILNSLVRVVSFFLVWRFLFARSSYLRRIWAGLFHMLLRIVRLVPVF